MRGRIIILALPLLALLGAAWWLLHGETPASNVDAGVRPEAAPEGARPALFAGPRAAPTRVFAPPARPPDVDGAVLVRDVEDRMAVTVVDAGTGEAVPGLQIGWTVSRARVTPVFVLPNSVTDAQGNLEVPRGQVARLLPLAADWVIVTRAEAEVVADGRLYVSRWLTLSVVVAAASSVPQPFDPRRAQVVLDFMRRDSAAEAGKPAPYSHPWFFRHRFVERQMVGTPDCEGRVSFAAAWGAGWTLKARAPGCRATPVELRLPPPGEQLAELRLVLMRVPRVRGQVVDPDGRPISGAEVNLYSKRVFPSLAEGRWFDRQAEYPDTLHRHLERPHGTVVVQKAEGTSDAEGRFTLDVPFDGELTLAARANGMLFDLRRLPSTSEELDVEVQLARPSRPEQRVMIRRHGRPAAAVTLSDVTDPDLAIPRAVVVEEDGVLAEEFVLGRAYEFEVDGRRLSLRWDGRLTVDLDALERDELEREKENVPWLLR